MVYLGFCLGIIVALLLGLIGLAVGYLILKREPDAPIRIPSMGPTKRPTQRKKPIVQTERKAFEAEMRESERLS